LKQKIFISIPWFSPAYKAGGPIRSIANMVTSYKNDKEYFIFCGSKDVDGTLLAVKDFDCWISYAENVQVWYSSNLTTKSLKNQYEQLQPHFLYIIGLFDYDFNIYPLLNLKAKTKILSVRGMLHSGALSQKSIKKQLFLNLLRLLNIPKKVIFHATDATEQQYIKNVFGKKAIVKIANNFAAAATNNISYPEKQAGLLKLVTIALISPMKNHLLVLEALQHCTANIEYTIYGAVKDDTYWYQCRELIKELPKNIFVHYAGEISPNEVTNKLSENHVFIMPSKSENFGHAIAEALACGLPVITSTNTPWLLLKESNAGANVNFSALEIAAEINNYAVMDSSAMQISSKAALTYYADYQKKSSITQQYDNLFS
jgi:glycosyltransferase involved in cell wall biosynthesis